MLKIDYASVTDDLTQSFYDILAIIISTYTINIFSGLLKILTLTSKIFCRILVLLSLEWSKSQEPILT